MSQLYKPPRSVTRIASLFYFSYFFPYFYLTGKIEPISRPNWESNLKGIFNLLNIGMTSYEKNHPMAIPCQVTYCALCTNA
jgi:hypothetical protein